MLRSTDETATPTTTAATTTDGLAASRADASRPRPRPAPRRLRPNLPPLAERIARALAELCAAARRAGNP
ncbi:MAG TPA: hypothetical protein DDZ42_20335 [Candidatus Rokubacteria bacterium]|nr:MAG: hypothetical protein A2050_10055 [Candidatus Rokubacteria bacterium GWA2_73_35]HBH04227.1 hypothetical protein [Candidatus Rokubacteria bacterium]